MSRKKPAEDKLATEMEALALTMAKEMASGTDPTKEKIDGFKAVSTYFAQTRKLNLKTPAAEEDEGNFNSFRNKINGVNDGKPASN